MSPDRFHEVKTNHSNWRLFVLTNYERRIPAQPKPARAWYGLTICVFALVAICLLWRFGA